jgi:uncharacterized protein
VLAVLDTSVVIPGIGWDGEARHVLALLARRAFASIRSPALTQEWAETLREVSTHPKWRNPNWVNWLEWLKSASRYYDDPPAKAIVRDPKDDPILALAISKGVDFLVSYDKDFLVLEKPYGVQCVHPTDFLRLHAGD